MTIKFFINNAENSRIDKTDYLEEVLSVEGTLRDSCSIISPTIQVQHVGFLNANYVYIEDFNRYYFINEIVSVRLNLWEVRMTVDVLMSFKSQIRSLNGYVTRWQYSEEYHFIDNKRRFSSIPDLNITKLPSVPWADYEHMHSVSRSLQYPWYVVILDNENGYIGGSDTNGYQTEDINYSTPLPNLLDAFGADLFKRNYLRIVICTSSTFLGWLAESTDRSTHVVSAYVLPNPNAYLDNNVPNNDFIRMCGGSSTDNDFSNIKLTELQVGKETFDASNTIMFEVMDSNYVRRVYSKSIKITNKVNKKYWLGSPYYKRLLYIPMYGTIELPDDALFNSEICLNISFDITIGIYSCSLTYFKNGLSTIIDTFEIAELPKIPMTYNGSVEYLRQKSYNNLIMSMKAIDFGKGLIGDVIKVGVGGLESFLGNATSAGVSTMADGVSGLATSGYDLGSLFLQADAMELINIQRGKSISISSSYSTYQISPFETCLIEYSYALADDDDNYAYLNGLPYYKTVQLNLNGFFVVQNLHLENLNCFEQEKDLIKQLLANGVIG